MTVYVDSSAVLRWLLGSPGRFRGFGKWKKAGACELVNVECNRTLDRFRLEGTLDDGSLVYAKRLLKEFLESIYIFKINETILDRATAPFSTVIGTLDAIHLSTALTWIEEEKVDLVLLSHDRQLKTAAEAFGITTVG